MKIVVSGASRGIGRAVALKLAEEGHQVLALARSSSALEDLERLNPPIKSVAVDLLNLVALQEKVKPILEEWGQVDALLNNAGHLVNKSFLETKASDFLAQYESNVISAVNLSQCCIPYMPTQSHILNISSMGGVQGSSKFPGLSAYSASKGAMSILTECMAEELKEKGVRVNALALGAVQTDMLEKAFPGFEAPLKANEMAAYISRFAMEAHHYINGKIIPVSLGNP
ncbi:MAG: SDR family oxidoreductase [Vicingaceae bacterium]